MERLRRGFCSSIFVIVLQLFICNRLLGETVACTGGYLDQTTKICYIYRSDSKTRDEAQQVCQGLGASLASIQSVQEQTSLETLLTQNGVQSAVWLSGKLQQTTYNATNYRWISECSLCGRDGGGAPVTGQGCYHDNNMPSDFSIEITNLQSSMTPDRCVAACRTSGYRYAGLEEGNRCYCGNGYGRYGHIDSSFEALACTIDCSGNASIQCGGSQLAFIYDVQGSYAAWGYGKPNSYGGYQTCGVMHRGVSYKFDDDNCGTTLALFVCDIPAANCDTTRTGYLLIGSSCYYIPPYSGQLPLKSWFKARETCVALGGDLAKIPNEAVRMALVPNLVDEKYWIGLVGLVWYWINGYDFMYTNWYNGNGDRSRAEPNLRTNKCVIADPANGYMWYDSDCAQLNGFVCQIGGPATLPALTTTITARPSPLPTDTPPVTTRTVTSPILLPTTPMSTTPTPFASPTIPQSSTIGPISTTSTTTTTTATTSTTIGTPISSTATTPIPSQPPSLSSTTTISTTTTYFADNTTASRADNGTTSGIGGQDGLTTTLSNINSNSSGTNMSDNVNNHTTTTVATGGNNNSTDSNGELYTQYTGADPRSGKSTDSSGLSTGMIILIILIIVLFIIALICIILFCCCRDKGNKVEKIDMRNKASLPEGDDYYSDPASGSQTKLTVD